MKKLFFTRTGMQQVFASPTDGETVCENPPAIVWITPRADTVFVYTVTVTDENGNVAFSGKSDTNVIIPSVLKAGKYTYRITAQSGDEIMQSDTVSFTVAETAVSVPRPTPETVIAGLPKERPRHLFCQSDIPTLLKERPEAVEALKRNIAQAYKDGLPERPHFHTDSEAVPYRQYFGRFRDYCDRNLVACSLGYQLLGDEKAGMFAKKLFLHILDWNPHGPCSVIGAWGDEVGLSCSRCLPAVFDLLYPLLTDKERDYAADTIADYAADCEKRLLRANYMQNPGESHSGRLSGYLGEAALSLWGTKQPKERLMRWLTYAMSIYNSMFPYFGGDDGSWAEGTFYSTSYTKWFLPFFSAVSRFAGTEYSWFRRPFYRNYARFLLHFALPDHEIHPFGDGYWCYPESPEWPGFFAQNPFHIYADLSGLAEAKAYDRALSSPDLHLLHLLDLFLPVKAPSDIPPSAPVTDADAFPDGGYVSLHSDRTNPKNDFHLIARASKFASGSHRQPDNGSFALFYGGHAMITPSGYFGYAYGTKHHMGWGNTTKAHNAILVDGEGQHYRDFTETGKILSCGIENGERVAVLELSESYKTLLTKWVRKFRMTDAKHLIVEDEIEADRDVTITYPLHTMSKPIVQHGNKSLTVTRGGTIMSISPEAGSFIDCTLSDRYDIDLNEGVPENCHVTMPEQYHIYYQTEKRSVHHLKVCYTIL